MENLKEDAVLTNPPRKVEIIDDIVYMSPAPSVKHHNIMFNITMHFKNYLRGKKCRVHMECNVYYNPDKPKNHIIPDISVMCEPNKFKPNGYYGVPSLIVEILSSNRKDDLITKLELYERLGVSEYWIVDPSNDTINQYVLLDGKFKFIEVYSYFSQEEFDELSLDDRENYKAFVTCNLFNDLEISLEDIFKDTMF
ncbi:MAG: hypothetical protein ATN35_12375 [Epulopiscium sp. Nele67-Bin004]|nr:MAG: hypothetical protein ATN35_12375 [Epulopiscium sp. Nele67-Bin004]